MGILDDIATYLQSSGIGTVGSNIFLQLIPDTPVVSCGIFRTGGYVNISDPTRRPTFQIAWRDTVVESGFAQTERIYQLLNNTWDTLPNYPGRWIPQHEPGPMYIDITNRPVFTVNFIHETTTPK